LLKILEKDLKNNSTITDIKRLDDFRQQINVVKWEIDSKLEEDVRKAMSFNDEDIVAAFDKYVDNLMGYCNREKVFNLATSAYDEPSESYMSMLEEHMGINEQMKRDFRQGVSNSIAGLTMKGKKFTYQSDERIEQGLKNLAFKTKMKHNDFRILSHTGIKDEKTMEQRSNTKSRLIDELGYCEVCSTLTMDYMSRLQEEGKLPSKNQ
jgi:serine protein kinase